MNGEAVCERSSLVATLGRPSTRHLTLFQKVSYGMGHIFNDICAAMWFSYILLFLQVVIGMPPALSGAMLLTGQVVDALATPVVGVLADRLGNRKLWHFIGTITVAISFPLIFMHCPGSSTAWSASLYYAAFIVVFQIGWAMVQISHLSLITDLTPSKKERAELTAIRYTASVCAGVGVYSVTWVVFHATKTEFSDKISLGDDYKFRDIVIAGSVVGLITTVWFHLGVPKTNTIQRIRESRVRDMTSLWQGTLQYLCSLVLLQVALLYVASRMFHTLCLVYMPLYLSESVSEDSETLATVPLLTYIASFVPSFGIKYLSTSLGNKGNQNF